MYFIIKDIKFINIYVNNIYFQINTNRPPFVSIDIHYNLQAALTAMNKICGQLYFCKKQKCNDNVFIFGGG